MEIDSGSVLTGTLGRVAGVFSRSPDSNVRCKSIVSLAQLLWVLKITWFRLKQGGSFAWLVF